MSDKFTIKFKGVLDHAATKKAIEQDITKMEKYLKPKKSNLGSTKDIVKSNLSDKKKELSKQSKFESLRERVEKYRLTQTKKLMKQGMGFEKARKEAFKRSLMSDRDKRRLEYKELAKESKAKSKLLAASQGKGLVAKIAIGSALGNVIGNAMSKIGGGLIGFLYGFAKKSVEDKAKQDDLKQLNNVIYTEKERTKIWNELEKMKGFERNLEKEDLLRTASVLRGHLRELGLNDKEGENTSNAAILAARFKSIGLAGSNESAVEIVSEMLLGNMQKAYDLMKPIDKFGKKYLESARSLLEMKTKEGGDLKLRPQAIKDLMRDLLSLKITGHSDELNRAKSNLAKLEQNLQNATTKVLMPIIGKISDLIEKVMNFNFKDLINDIVNGIRDGVKGVFGGIKNIGSKVGGVVSTGFSYINPFGDNFLGGFFNSRGHNNNDDFGNFP
ncbi:DUF759 family protein (plasmid) [Borreliella yangtzensis]|uniref:Uncharacterized protein n=1 Tax=Borreliella yangtzensis TaxID=683292 RepID=A0ABR6PFU7_9SPIR|nr:hypothetical protein [Borreliella yangtzensis]